MPRYAVNVITRRNGRVLVLKRQHGRALGGGLWGFPGGHIESGETPLAAATRELREECGAIATYLVRYLPPLIIDSNAAELTLVHRQFAGGVISLNEEHDDYRWVEASACHGPQFMSGIRVDLILLGLLER